MRILRHLTGVSAFVLAIVMAGGSASALQDNCADISERYEEAMSRRAMIAARHAVLNELRNVVAPEQVLARINNEIAALSRIGLRATPEDVIEDYMICRFELDRGVTGLVDGPQTVVASNCRACEVSVAVTNATLDSFQNVARQGDSTGVLRGMLDERNQQIQSLLACEQMACREPALKHNMAPLTAAGYLRAYRAAVDPFAWAAEPIVVSELPDYAVMQTPAGQYPVIGPGVGQ